MPSIKKGKKLINRQNPLDKPFCPCESSGIVSLISLCKMFYYAPQVSMNIKN